VGLDMLYGAELGKVHGKLPSVDAGIVAPCRVGFSRSYRRSSAIMWVIQNNGYR